MTIQVEFWQLITILTALMGASGWGFKLLLNQVQRHLDFRLDTLAAEAKASAEQRAKVEREVFDLKAALPLAYVLRDDHIRGQAIIENKLDGLARRFEYLSPQVQGDNNDTN